MASSGLGKLLGLGMGIATGNPMQIAGALASGTPAGNALNLYNTGSDIADKFKTTPYADKAMGSQFAGQSPSLRVGSLDSGNNLQSGLDKVSAANSTVGVGNMGDALSRRLSDPSNAVSQGMQALHDPNIPSEYKLLAAQPIMEAHYLNPNKVFSSGGF